MDTRHVDRSRNNGLCVRDKRQQILEIGEANYEFEYNVDHEKAFVAKPGEYMREVMHQSSLPICQSPTPSKGDVYVGEWRLLGTSGRGSELVVVSAISLGKQLVAVKALDGFVLTIKTSTGRCTVPEHHGCGGRFRRLSLPTRLPRKHSR